MNHLPRYLARTALVLSLAVPLLGCSDDTTDDAAGTSTTDSPASTVSSTAEDSSGGTTSAPADGISGTWSGGWERTAPIPGNGELTLDLSDDGGALSGSVTVTGSACMTTHDVSGTPDGDTVPLAVSDGGITADYEATRDSTRLSGTMTATCPDVGTGTGTWSVSLEE